jgi:YHS domain-containing protein
MHTTCEQCKKGITITGDGSRPFVTEREGGPSYFCSETCKNVWLDERPQLRLRGVVVGLTRDAIPFSGFDELTAITTVANRR